MKKLTLLMSALLIGVVAFAADAPKVTLDFSTKEAIEAWGLPSDYKTTEATGLTYTSGGNTITMISTSGGFKGIKGENGNYLIMKTNSILQLPAFDFAVSKILVYVKFPRMLFRLARMHMKMQM